MMLLLFLLPVRGETFISGGPEESVRQKLLGAQKSGFQSLLVVLIIQDIRADRAGNHPSKRTQRSTAQLVPEEAASDAAYERRAESAVTFGGSTGSTVSVLGCGRRSVSLLLLRRVWRVAAVRVVVGNDGILRAAVGRAALVVGGRWLLVRIMWRCVGTLSC